MRCKFICNNIIINPTVNTAYVVMSAVVNGSKENEEFFRYTPSGDLTLQVVNPSAIESLRVGKQYYIDITEEQDEI